MQNSTLEKEKHRVLCAAHAACGAPCVGPRTTSGASQVSPVGGGPRRGRLGGYLAAHALCGDSAAGKLGQPVQAAPSGRCPMEHCSTAAPRHLLPAKKEHSQPGQQLGEEPMALDPAQGTCPSGHKCRAQSSWCAVKPPGSADCDTHVPGWVLAHVTVHFAVIG